MRIGQEAHEREELRERIERWMDTPLDLLSISLLGSLVAENALPLSPAWEGGLDAFNWFTWAVFTGAFFLQLALAPEKGRYLRSNWLGAISVLLPAFRVLRVFRTLRVLRAARALRGVRLVRVLTATNRITRSLNDTLAGYQFGRVLALTLAVVLIGAAALVYFEPGGAGRGGERYLEAMWWTLGFVTTVGTDFQPATLEGRVVTLLLVIWGLGVFGYITGAVASYFVGREPGGDAAGTEAAALRREVAELRAMLLRIAEIREGEEAEPAPPVRASPAGGDAESGDGARE